MEIILTVLGIAAYLWLFIAFLRHSFLAISPERHQINGLLFLINNCLFVLPALVIVMAVGPLNIRVLFYVEPQSVFLVNTIILYSLWVFIFALALFSRFFGRRLYYDLRHVYAELSTPAVEARLLDFIRVAMISIAAAILVNIVVFGGQHALFGATFYDLKAGVIRHANESSAFAAYAKHYFHVVSLLMAPCLALPLYQKRPKERWLAIVMIFAALTSHGSKSPFIFFLVVFAIALLEKNALNGGKVNGSALFSPRRILAAMTTMMMVLILFYFLAVSFFLTEPSLFWDYFWNRVFVGQMAGVYEQFNLLIYDPDFAWHSVPFARFFMDYPNFHKELMLISENRVNPDSIGIKVTFFAAEAYGMFGWVGVIFAPVLIAFQFVITFLILNAVLHHTIFKSKELSKYVTGFFFVSYFSFTDGISEMVMYKGCILILMLLLPIVFTMALRGTWINKQRRGTMALAPDPNGARRFPPFSA